jgi:hypothetical protein
MNDNFASPFMPSIGCVARVPVPRGVLSAEHRGGQ